MNLLQIEQIEQKQKLTTTTSGGDLVKTRGSRGDLVQVGGGDLVQVGSGDLVQVARGDT
jgi:hypothetical protein